MREFQTSEAETFIRFVRDDVNWNIRGMVEACLIAIDHPDFPLFLVSCYILNHIVVQPRVFHSRLTHPAKQANNADL
jgi:hypothetical protein